MQTFKIRLNRIGSHYPGRPCLGCRVLLSVVPTCWLLLSMWYVTPLGQHSSSYWNRRLSRGIDGCYARRGRLQLLTRFISYVMRAERFFPLRRLVSSARVTRADKLLHNPHLLVVKGHSLGLLRARYIFWSCFKWISGSYFCKWSSIRWSILGVARRVLW